MEAAKYVLNASRIFLQVSNTRADATLFTRRRFHSDFTIWFAIRDNFPPLSLNANAPSLLREKKIVLPGFA